MIFLFKSQTRGLLREILPVNAGNILHAGLWFAGKIVLKGWDKKTVIMKTFVISTQFAPYLLVA